MDKTLAVWDLGRTNCEVGIITHDSNNDKYNCEKIHKAPLEQLGSLDELIEYFENALSFSMKSADAICIAGSGVYDGSCLIHENPYPYTLNFADTIQKHQWKNCHVVNDFVPVIFSTFSPLAFDPEHVLAVKEGLPKPYGCHIAFGAGTGLGIKDARLLPSGDICYGDNEMGHMNFVQPVNATLEELNLHNSFLEFLVKDHGFIVKKPLLLEDVLSGRGTSLIWEFFNSHDKNISAKEVDEALDAGHGDDVLKLFAWYLGMFTGLAQVTFMPSGGVWITGGVVRRHLNLFDYDDFERGLLSCSSHMHVRKDIPITVITSNRHVMMGGAKYLMTKLERQHVHV